jgi:8-oxo-dGTP diphosphatase
MRKIAAIVIYKGNKVLLQHRSNDAPKNPGKWGFFGGGLENDETPLEAIHRESFEELRYRPTNPVFLYEGTHDLRHIYVFTEPYDESQQLVQGEGQAMGWFTIEEANKLDIVPYALEILKRINNK